MQEVYQISLIPAYKPWRGFSNIYTTNKEIFDLFGPDSWLPDMSVAELPEHLRRFAVENSWDDEKGESVPYIPNGTENWEEGTAIVDGEEVELEMYLSTFLYNIESEDVKPPFLLLDTVQAYTE